MTYDAIESSVASGSPLELYEFSVGGAIYRFSSGEDAVTIGPDTYEPAPVSRGEITVSAETARDTLTIKIPSSTSFAQEFSSVPPGAASSVTILRLHRTDGDDETAFIYRGTIRTVSFIDDGRTASVVVMPSTGDFQTNAPRTTYQGTCNNYVYDERCGAVRSSFTHTNTVTAIGSDGLTLTITGIGAFIASLGVPDDAMVGGIFQFGSQYTMIQSQSAVDDQITLTDLPYGVVVGSSVSSSAGCQRIPRVCHRRFGRFASFRATTYVPIRNIFTGGVL